MLVSSSLPITHVKSCAEEFLDDVLWISFFVKGLVKIFQIRISQILCSDEVCSNVDSHCVAMEVIKEISFR